MSISEPAGEWWDHASCLGVDPNLFFPERGEPADAAKQICAGCPVRQPCLDYALTHVEKFGVWGGLSERQRRKLRVEHRHQPIAELVPDGVTGTRVDNVVPLRARQPEPPHQTPPAPITWTGS